MKTNFDKLACNTQAGVGLPAAIFVITVLVVIAFGVSQLVSQNAETFEEEMNSSAVDLLNVADECVLPWVTLEEYTDW